MSDRRRKYRPPIRAIIVLLLLIAVATPMIGLFFFRVFENQLIRKTESELIAQSAALAAAMQAETAALPLGALGAPVELGSGYLLAYSPAAAALDLASDPVLPPRPAPAPAAPAGPEWARVGAVMDRLIDTTRRRTLAGIEALDPRGIILTGPEAGRSLAHVEEVREALDGRLGARLRTRLRARSAPLIYYVTKGASLRIFTAFPVIDRGRVAGVIYASRTPAHMLQVAWEERRSLAFAAAATLIALLAFGFVATRAVTGPIRALTLRTRRVAAGDRDAMRPLPYHGTREVAELSETFLRSARKLHDRSESLAAFAAHVAHELKSPLTAIQGAAELVRDAEAEMTPETRRAFLSNIVADAERMTLLVRRLLELARAEAEVQGPPAAAAVRGAAAAVATPLKIDLSGAVDACVSMQDEKLIAVLGNLADNAARHGASRLRIGVDLAAGRALIRVSDDGAGVSKANRAKIFDPFFTTRRAEGGTGMGLSIVRALIEAHDGSIRLAEPAPEDPSGAVFEIDLPLAAPGV
ncbi:HAMP domain-containing sensor histidine kinase [Pikeienuella sp. HZG-20]|uniref:sensor histidine kinase n=1 Tax=Paludibacillus litoralis TaxID=3133267 RepID=UPI0030EDF415